MNPRFEDYHIKLGYTIAGLPCASITEFFALISTGTSHEEAVEELRRKFELRISHMREEGRAIPLPDSAPEPARFAPNEKVDALRPFVDEFWSKVLGTSYSTSFVSNESRFSSWEHYVGGRDQLIERIKDIYNVDVSEFYEQPIHKVLSRIRDHIARR